MRMRKLSKSWIYTIAVGPLVFFMDWIDHTLGGWWLFGLGVPYAILARLFAERFGKS